MNDAEALGAKRVIALASYVPLSFFAFPQVWPGTETIVDGGVPLAVLAVAALLVGTCGLGALRAARLAFVASLVAHVAIFHWFAVATLVYGGMAPALGALAPLLPAVYTALFTASFAAATSRALTASGTNLLVMAAAFTGFEQGRAVLLGGFPWASPGYAGWQSPLLLGLAPLAGVHLMTFAIVLVAAVLARGIVLRRFDRESGIALAVLFALLSSSVLLFDELPEPQASIRVAAIQANIDQREKWSPARAERNLERHPSLSRRAAVAGAELIVWPETAIPGFFEVDPKMRDPIEALARETGASFVIGGAGVAVARGPAGDTLDAVYDSAFVIDFAGQLRDRYDKTKLVPFGEFLPLRSWFGDFFEAIARGVSSRDLVPGAAPRSVEVPLLEHDEALRVGVAICYELLFPDAVRRMPKDGAQLLLGITNDAWYGRTGARPQFLAITAVRAAETGTPLLRAANSGISALVGPNGQVQKQSRWDVQDVLVGDIPLLPQGGPGEARSLYAQYGDVFAWVCAAIACSMLIGSVASRRHADEPSDRPPGAPLPANRETVRNE